MSSFQIVSATRGMLKPLIALYAESGCGKTYSALLLARGFAGPDGKICMIDTESGRGSLYADVLPGGYQVLNLDPPFSPQRYCEAMKALEDSGAAIGVIDSGSHCWEGEGGVLDMAAANEERTGKTGLHVWRAPKLAHGLFVRSLLRSRVPWIICLRAKYRTRQVKVDSKTQIVRDESLSPLQAEDFLFELTAHGTIDSEHRFYLTKVNHPALKTCFPQKSPITIEHGKLLSAWCAAGAAPGTASPHLSTGSSSPASAPPVLAPGASPGSRPPKTSETPEARRARWVQKCMAAGGGSPSYAFEWAVENGILLDTESLDDWPDSKLPKTKPEAGTILNAIAAKSGVAESITP